MIPTQFELRQESHEEPTSTQQRYVIEQNPLATTELYKTGDDTSKELLKIRLIQLMKDLELGKFLIYHINMLIKCNSEFSFLIIYLNRI